MPMCRMTSQGVIQSGAAVQAERRISADRLHLKRHPSAAGKNAGLRDDAAANKNPNDLLQTCDPLFFPSDLRNWPLVGDCRALIPEH
jgi:hypothetical protein